MQGVFLKTWDETEETGDCTTKEDWNDAQEICQKLNIPIRQVDFVKEYWTDVFEYVTSFNFFFLNKFQRNEFIFPKKFSVRISMWPNTKSRRQLQ